VVVGTSPEQTVQPLGPLGLVSFIVAHSSISSVGSELNITSTEADPPETNPSVVTVTVFV
jgi:hypothetical protein